MKKLLPTIRQTKKPKLELIIVVLMIACLGVLALISGHAATPFISSEAESGILANGAALGSSTAASGGKYVQFKSASTGTSGLGDNKMLCIYTANSISAVATLSEEMNNTPIHCINTYTNNALTWAAWETPWIETPGSSNDNYATWLASNSLNRLTDAIQLVPEDVDVAGSPGYDANWMADCAAGDFESYAVTLGQGLVKDGFASIMIRPGIEMNGNWNDDSLGADPTTQSEANWAGCFAKTVTAMRTVAGSHFLFNWNINQGYRNIPFANYYPGNAYVDVIGMDAYDSGMPGNPTTQPARWNAEYSEASGLEDISAFAIANNKPLSIPEWGLDSTNGSITDDPYYVQQLADLVQNNDIAYESYFNSNDDNIPTIQSESNSFAAFKAAYDTGGTVGPGTSW